METEGVLCLSRLQVTENEEGGQTETQLEVQTSTTRRGGGSHKQDNVKKAMFRSGTKRCALGRVGAKDEISATKTLNKLRTSVSKTGQKLMTSWAPGPEMRGPN